MKEFTLMILDYPTGMPVISGAYEAYDNFSTFLSSPQNHQSPINHHISGPLPGHTCDENHSIQHQPTGEMIAGTDGDLKSSTWEAHKSWGMLRYKTCSFRSDFTGVSLKPKLWSSFQVCDFRLNFLLAAAVGLAAMESLPLGNAPCIPWVSPRNISATRRHIPARSWCNW